MSSKPRILIVITQAATGGAQSVVGDLVPALVHEFDVTVAAGGTGPLEASVMDAGATFVRLRHLRRPISPLHDVCAVAELWCLCRVLRPAIVHANSSKAGVLARLAAAFARVPARVFTVHGWAFKATHGLSSRIYLHADRAMLPLSTTIICVSETEKRAGLVARTCDERRTVVIRNGVDVKNASVRKHRDEQVVRIVSVGRLAEPKDFLTLVSAAALLDATRSRIDVLGDGPDRAIIEHEIDRLGLAGVVDLVGEVDDVQRRLAQADVFVLSSRSEGLPISVLEAMAAGLPVVATDVGGLGEMVEEGGSGFLVPPGDPPALAARLSAFIDDSELRASFGSRGRTLATERFSLEENRRRHLDLYGRLVAGRRPIA